VIDDKTVEITDNYPYLGVCIDNNLNLKQHVQNQVKKANRRMYFLRVMNNLKVDTNIMSQFYNATICPVLNYASCSFFNMLNVKDRNDLNRPRRKGRKLLKQNDLIEHDILCNKKTLTLLDRILNDNKQNCKRKKERNKKLKKGKKKRKIRKKHETKHETKKTLKNERKRKKSYTKKICMKQE
jgi:hypothetical protein